MYIINKLQNADKYTEAELACIRYSYLSIRNDMIKVMVIIGLSAFAGVGKEAALILITMFPVRVMMGGIHQKSFSGCLVVSFAWVATGVCLARLLAPWSGMMVYMILISVLIPVHFEPSPSANKKYLSSQEKKKRKKIAVVSEIVFILIMVIIDNPVCKNCIGMGLLIDNIQVLIINRRKSK